MTSSSGRDCPLPTRRVHQGLSTPVDNVPKTRMNGPSFPPVTVASEDKPLPTRRSLNSRPPISGYVSIKAAIVDRLPKSAIGRGAALAGMGVAVSAVVAPLVGFAVPLSDASASEKVVGTFGADASWQLTAAEDSSFVQADSLNFSQAATSRAKLRTPIEVSSCVIGDQPANGSREITQKSVIYWPLQEGTYTETSPFSWRISPISGQLLMHEGVDMAAPAGTPIYAALSGEVVEVSSNSQSGGYITLRHELNDGSVFFTSYLHQYTEDIMVKVGQTVDAGEQIGKVGNAGWSTGAHLHFEVRTADKTAIEPMAWMQEHGAVFLGQGCP